MENYADIFFKEAVADLQREDGMFDRFQRMYPGRTSPSLTDDEVRFIASANSFYMATVSADGWPYVQHRGGRRGFLRPTGPAQLAYADYRGNRQFISTGHLKQDDRVSIFLMDYLNKGRLKMQGHARILPVAEVEPELVAQLDTDGGVTERVGIIDVIATDWNCPQYIPDLYPADVVRQISGDKLAELQAENQALKDELAILKGERR
ncbi:MAG: pyridoxamine 5'-phosphate oxidase family protein [Pseudomonadota bacterium]